jgi:hypothetical protein
MTTTWEDQKYTSIWFAEMKLLNTHKPKKKKKNPLLMTSQITLKMVNHQSLEEQHREQ